MTDTPDPAVLDTYDELAGVVDLFDAMTRDELADALAELAFKQGADVDRAALETAIESAVEEYVLVEYDPADGPPLLAVGPVAFPALPPNAEDLPHILDVPDREVDRQALGEQVTERLLGDAAQAADAGDEERIHYLLDVSYDLEAWAPVDVSAARERLDAALEE